MADWEKTSTFNVGHVPVELYKSKNTGLQLILAQVEGPLINANIVVATECLSDDGLPHTLEHLVFLGSEDYPYKGVLDKVAFRNLATGTNAYTDVHHTAYQLTTAGRQGMLALLPVFMDHVVFPTITEGGFVTEVYHIDGEGNDAGVVYCEMQAIENEARSVAYLQLRRLLYPGVCGFASETGGLMADIRTLTVDRIREYHKSYYRADNICVVITGKVDAADVFRSLEGPELKMKNRGAPVDNSSRPWFTHPVPPLSESVDVRVEFPTDEEDTGCVMIGWRTVPWSNFEEAAALHVLHAYLTESEVSLLYREFVEGGEEGQPLCAALSCGLMENSETFQFCCFDAVTVDVIDQVKPKLEKVLAGLCDSGFDMDRMSSVIARFEAKHLNALEESPHDTLSHYLIQSFLFADQPEQPARKLSCVFGAGSLAVKSSAEWVDLLRRHFLSSPSVCVRAFPSAARAADLQTSEQRRIAERVSALGEEQLQSLGGRVDKANEENNKEVPPSLVSHFSVPDVASISFTPVASAFYPPPPDAKSYAEPQLRTHLDEACPASPPFYLQVDHVPSDFVEIRVVLNTDALPPRLRLYLELYLEAAYSLPTVRNGAEVPYEQLVTELQEKSVNYGNSLGVGGGNFTCGAFSQVAMFTLKARNTPESYQAAVGLLRDVLISSKFDVERLRVAAKNLVADVSEMKREGEVIAQALLREKIYREGSNHQACNLIRQHRFLSATIDALDGEESSSRVLAEMEEMRGFLTDPSNVFCQVVADAFKLGDVKSPWLSFLGGTPPGPASTTPASVSYARTFHKECVGSPDGSVSVLSMAAIESSFLFAAARGLPGFGHVDTAPMLVAIELLCCIEGPMWREIRGLGLAYSFGMYGDADEGLVYFSLARSSSLPRAFAQAAKLVQAYASEAEVVEAVALENAIASVVSAVVSREQTVSACGLQSLMSALRASGPGHNGRLVRSVQAVSPDDVRRVLSAYLVNVFDPSAANVAVTTNANKLEEVVSGLEEGGWRVERLESLDGAVK